MKIDLFKETCHKFLSKINDPKIVTERLKKDIIKLVIDEVVIEGESVKIFATIPLPNKIHEREMDKTDIHGTFNAGATLGPVNETNMTRIWNKHKQTNTPLKRKVFVAMSGGVDSSTAAALLVKGGNEVIGITLKLFCYAQKKENEKSCCSLKALARARRVCQKLKIKHYLIDCQKEFKKEIIDNFVSEYEQGRTPNPCIRCNQFIKFGFLLKKARRLGMDYIATGHYVRIKEVRGEFRLLKGIDSSKDQSYFLYSLTQDQLKKTLFPLGNYLKKEVRHLAKKWKLDADKVKESQEVCFVENNDLTSFFKKRIKIVKGHIKDANTKEILGKHKGLPFYTIGQRKGIGLGGGNPYYVVKIDVKNNFLWVTNNSDDKRLFKKNLDLNHFHWISCKENKFPLKVKAKARYGSKEEEGIIEKKNNFYFFTFKYPQRAIALGQSLVLYKGKEVLGGAVI